MSNDAAARGVVAACTFGLGLGACTSVPEGGWVTTTPLNWQAPATAGKARVIVLTDIGNEPDDAMSMVRLLTYANELDIEGLLATTSRSLRNKVNRDMIERRIAAYGEVLPNLRVHAEGHPDPEDLLAVVRSGVPMFGMSGVGDGMETEASRHIIEAVDRPDPRPVWITVWGGAADLAQALWTVRSTRSPEEVDRFISKLRVYSISDQDDAGPWARAQFPRLFWITSVHAMGDYGLSTWIGITAPSPGVRQDIVSQPWLNENVRTHGPLGALYPRTVFAMEGDTPSFLYLIPNGLSDPEHPDWGGWGGRYAPLTDFLGLWTSTTDRPPGIPSNHQASVSRWREQFQNDFAARMDWTVQSRFEDANHAPVVMLNGEAGASPVVITTCAGEAIRLSAAGTSDPDGNELTYNWMIYQEVAEPTGPSLQMTVSEGAETTVTATGWSHGAETPLLETYQQHVVLSVTDNGAPALTRYRRAIINVKSGGEVNGEACPAPTIRSAQHSYDDNATELYDMTSSRGPSIQTPLGELLDNPEARAVLDRQLPGFASTPGIANARDMPLFVLRQYVPALTDEAMAAIEAELSALSAN